MDALYIGVVSFVDTDEQPEDQNNVVGTTETFETHSEVIEAAEELAERYLKERFGDSWMLSIAIGEHLVKLDITTPGQMHANLFLETLHAEIKQERLAFSVSPDSKSCDTMKATLVRD